jgi:hypothetical protein
MNVVQQKKAGKTKIILVIFWLVVLAGALIWIVKRPQLVGYSAHSNTQTNITGEDNRGVHIEGCFYKISNEIYCGDKKSILVGADIKTFQVLGYSIAKDKNNVYVLNKAQTGLDTQSFKKYSKVGLALYDLFSDKNGIYNINFDNTFTTIPLDISTATSVDAFYIKDKNGIYFNGNQITRVTEADLQTFHILGGCVSVERSYAEYAADKNYVFVGTQVLRGIDPLHFTQIVRIDSDEGEMPYSFYLWKDLSHIYVYCGTPIKEADYATFEYKDGRAQDVNNYYDFNTGGGSYAVVPKR